jgi:hypothetical protein
MSLNSEVVIWELSRICDGHVAAMNPWVLFNPTNTARMWNYDHEPHSELWQPDLGL